MDSQINGKRKRRGGPKVKTGCPTCKLRRVKCDETTPACLRCLKFGIECVSSEPPVVAVPQRARIRALQPKNSVSTQIPIAPSTGLFVNEQEYRYFDLFCTKTVFEILPGFDSEVLRRILLQACDCEPSIRHAVVAIGALDKKSEEAQAGSSSFSDCGNGLAIHHQDALLQYSKAIKHMRAAVSKGHQNLRTTLLTCFTIIIFEACLGHDRLVLDQIRTGVLLLRDWTSKYPDAAKHVLGFSSPAPNIIEQDLIRAFARLEIQNLATLDEEFLGHHYSPRKGTKSIQRIGDEDFLRNGTETVQEMPKVFTTLTQARRYLEVILKCSLVLKRLSQIRVPPSTNDSSVNSPLPGQAGLQNPEIADCPLKASTSTQAPLSTLEDLLAYQAVHRIGLSQWNSCFDDLSKGLCHQGQNDSAEVITIRLHAKMTRVALETALAYDPSVFDEYTSEFEDSITLSRELFKTNTMHKSATLGFTADLGVIIPLWLTGLKCRVRSIRQQAVSLLHSYPTQEGVWNSQFAAKMIEWVNEVEEKQQQQHPPPAAAALQVDSKKIIPVASRIHGILWSFDSGYRTANLVCQHRPSESSHELVTRRTKISW